MKSKQTLLLSACIILFLCSACDKELVEKADVVQPDPITPDLTVKITSSVSGFVTDETGNPIMFASVAAGDKVALTDAYGYFKIVNASLAEMAGQVNVIKTGYFDGYKTFTPLESKETFVRLKLLTKSETGTVDAAAGGAVATSDGGKITLPANGIVTAKEGAVYSGQVHISARLINPSEESSLHLDMPGDSRGTDTDGHLKALKTFSTIAVELTGSSGQLLQLAEGKPATLSLPIPSSLMADAPTTIDLWSYDTKTGLWKQEGTATKTGDVYIGTVTHFSFWEGAEGIPLVNFTAQITDATAQPLANVPVSITMSGMPKNAGYGRFGYTDANGFITGAVFANSNLVLDILTPCALTAYSHEFATTATDIDLGTLTGNLGQNTVTLNGTVTNCDNQPVADGYVQTYDNGFYNRIAIHNGAFSFTGLACTNTIVNVVVVDYATDKQNAPKEVTITSGANNLGTLSACGTSAMGNITYTLDDNPTVFILEPTDTLAGYNLVNDATQILTLSGNPNESQKMAFQFDGGKELGSAHKFIDLFSNVFPSGRGYWPASITVNVTEYGPVGGFIAGNFSSPILNFDDNALHNITVSFRVKRLN